MSQESSKPKILVLGSLAWEIALIPDVQPDARNTFHKRGAWVGAPIIREMIQEALVESDCRNDGHVYEQVKAEIGSRLMPGALAESWKAEHNEITTVFKRFPKKSGTRKPTVLRVHKNYLSRNGNTDGLNPHFQFGV